MSAQPPAQKNSRSNRKRNSEKANNDYRITNDEGRRNVFCLFYKKIERSETTLRHSAVRCFTQAIDAGSLIIKKPCHFGVVSYERRLWPQASSLNK
jgi:hypothetical protein